MNESRYSFVGTDLNLNSVKTFIYLNVRMLFDPPNNSFVIDAMNKQIAELGWRLNVKREGVSWTDPDPTPPEPTPDELEMWDFVYGMTSGY